ncbi:MAG: HDOD domain-containing protein [Spartobacteria bacterium]|nr:HDOD domain-containing protein [Spartobacteria bacterium]
MDENRAYRIIFVDDEQDVLDGLQCMLWPRRNQWNMLFVSSARDAIALMKDAAFDVIVTDMRMPDMDGSQLLEHVITEYPQTIRFILSGYSDKEMIFKSLGPTHQFLAKPCDSDVLQRSIEHALNMREMFNQPKVQKVLSKVKTIPGLPLLYNEIVAILNSSDPSIRRVGRIIEKDMAMSAKVLQLVNSAFFGVRKHIDNIQQAISLLGLETLRSLVLMTSLFSGFKKDSVEGFSYNQLMLHTLRVAQLARVIAEMERFPHIEMDNMFTAGLLHDVGKLLLINNLPDEYAAALRLVAHDDYRLADAELEVFGITHAEAGAYLLGLWGLPDNILNAVAYHHTPQESLLRQFSALSVVHIANALDNHSYPQPTTHGVALNMDYIKRLGIADHLPRWQEIALKMNKRHDLLSKARRQAHNPEKKG